MQCETFKKKDSVKDVLLKAFFSVDNPRQRFVIEGSTKFAGFCCKVTVYLIYIVTLAAIHGKHFQDYPEQ